MPLYEIAILEKPTEKAAKEGAIEKLVFGPKYVVAKTEQGAVLHVMTGGGFEVDVDRAEVLVRPFALA